MKLYFRACLLNSVWLPLLLGGILLFLESLFGATGVMVVGSLLYGIIRVDIWLVAGDRNARTLVPV